MGFFRTNRSSTTSSANSTAPNSGITTPTTGDTLPTSPTSPTSTNAPPHPLAKQPSRLSLSKTLTWGKMIKEEKYRRRIASWEKEDRRRLCSKKEQEILRAFEWKPCRNSSDGGRTRSGFSAVSPRCSRVGSVDDGGAGVSSSPSKIVEGGHVLREGARSEALAGVARARPLREE